MQLKNKQDFWAGIMFAAIGTGFAIGATSYSMGTSARMGPGYFPFWLGVCLAVLGAAIALSAMKRSVEDTGVEKFDWKILGFIIGPVIIAGFVLNYLGIYITIFLLVLLSSMASHVFNWKVAIANSIFMVLFVWVTFVKGLGLIFPLWPNLPGI